ncbi:MAG: phosphonate ABC transporter, permease protein PhnE [Pseudomonadota bacterium]
MKKGYITYAAGAGIMMIIGFILPWLGKNPFQFSGFSFAMLGYPALVLIPISGAVALFFALNRKKQRPAYLMYPGMAGLLTLIFLISVVCLTDTGPLQVEWPIQGMELLRFNHSSNLIMLNPITDIGLGLILTLVGIAILFLLPLAHQKMINEPVKHAPDSYQNVIKKQNLTHEYKRSAYIFAALAILSVTWVWCGISPMKVWENRGNAKEYLFGRELNQSDLDYINEQKLRAPMIEASGRAEEYMSNKYRGVPFSKQPSADKKVKERQQFAAAALEKMTQKEILQLQKVIEKNALKQKGGGYFPPETSLIKIKGYLIALVETIAIAVWGTLLALICAIPVSVFAAKNTLKLIISSDDIKSISMRTSIAFGVRRFLDSCRGFNEFVMALIFVAVIGLGPYAGILALWIHTFGILGKVFSEQIEAIESGQVEALTSTGGSAAQVIAFSVMPQVLPGLVSYTLLRFESNVRSAAILGFVGAGGIGFLIFDKLNGYLFREVCTMMIIIIMTVSIIDHFCSKIRMKFI